MPQHTVLLVSDDLQSGQIWEFALSQLDLEVVLLTTPEEAIEWRVANVCDLIVIDETARDFDGVALIRRWRSEIAAPILLLTGGDYSHCLEAYAAGVDECAVKPVSPALFLAKVKAWLRHAATVPLALLSSVERGPFRLNPTTQEVVIADRSILLTNLEFRLMHYLVRNPNQVLPSQVLIERVWHYAPGAEGTVLKNAIYRLRQKVELNPTDPQFIISVTGEGYMFRL